MTLTVTVDPARFALTTTPSIFASACELTSPLRPTDGLWAVIVTTAATKDPAARSPTAAIRFVLITVFSPESAR